MEGSKGSAVRRLALLYDEAMQLHETGPGHPERPERLRAIVGRLQQAAIPASWPPFKRADRGKLELVHPAAYVTDIESLEGSTVLVEADTPVSPHSVSAARLAAGAAVTAVDLLLSGETSAAFALVRPPGHHAETARAMGFCLFNNIAIAAEHALRHHDLKRILIIDWDVHHGNGTQEIFYSRGDVLFVSLHQYPFYPGTGALHETGEGEGKGSTINFPLPAGTGDETYIGIFSQIIAPIARAYQPELILVSAGFDAHESDPLGQMGVTTEGFAAMCTISRDLASELCDGRIALVLEAVTACAAWRIRRSLAHAC